MITVISTGFNPPEGGRRCRMTVSSQEGVSFEHVFIDAAKQCPPKSHFENLINAIEPLPPERIVVCVDADDWLCTPSALAIIEQAHRLGAWVTWGSFKFADGRPGFAGPVHGNIRQAQWTATHCKSFRAGLFQQIRSESLRFEGDWMPFARDMALMMPLVELAGPARSVFVPNVTYVYNFESSGESAATPAERRREMLCVAHIRSQRPYTQTTTLAPAWATKIGV